MKHCPGGEIGRRATLRSLWGQPLAGSTPVLGTFRSFLFPFQAASDALLGFPVDKVASRLLSPLTMHPARLSVDGLLANCVVRVQRRGGPGGQHRNKVETAVVIEHELSGLRAEASERRSQADNRRVAIQRLRMRLALEFRDFDKTTVLDPPSLLWRSRMSGSRIDVSTEHEDFPAILAELLDALMSLSFDISEASKHFTVTSSQLVGLLRSYQPALTWVNAKRCELGLHRLR